MWGDPQQRYSYREKYQFSGKHACRKSLLIIVQMLFVYVVLIVINFWAFHKCGALLQ
jgi:hypothetical protein